MEFRVTVADPTYSKLLGDPGDPQHDDIKHELTDKVRRDSAEAQNFHRSIINNDSKTLKDALAWRRQSDAR